MSRTLVQDYLETQGLRLSVDEVEVARATLMAILTAVADQDIDANPWRLDENAAGDPLSGFFQLQEHLPQTAETQKLCQAVFAMLDSIAERHSASARVYIRANHLPDVLMRIAHIGQATSNHLSMSEEKALAADALFSRAAQTGWVNVIDNLAQWIQWGDAPEALQNYGLSHLAVPICDTNGAVLGLVTVSQSDVVQFEEEAQAWWVALAIALSSILPSHLPVDWLYQPPIDENE